MAKVFVVNKSSHDFSAAEKFGDLVFMTKGRMNRLNTNNMIREFNHFLDNSTKDDYILLCSLSVMNAIACSIFAHKHGTLNLLLFNNGRYIERNHIM